MNEEQLRLDNFESVREGHSSDEIPPGYKKTDVGIIPEEWEIRNLGQVGVPYIGLTYDPDSISYEGLLVLRSSNIDDGGLLKYTDNVYVNMQVPERLIVHKGDLLICVRNGSRPLIGKCALIDENASGATFGAFMSIFRADENPFIYFCFQSDFIKKQIHAHLGATINQITNSSLKSFQIPWPANSNERVAITNALLDVDNLIASLDNLISKKQAIKKATMQQLLTGRTRLPGFNDEWKKCNLGRIGKFLKGNGIRRDDLVDSGYPCILYGELYTTYRNYILNTISRIPRSITKVALPIETGDLLFTGSGETSEEIGKCSAYIGKEQAYAGGDIVVLRSLDYDSVFLSHLMNHSSTVQQKSRLAQGDAVVHISAKHLSQIEIYLPPIEEQRAITSILLDMDNEIKSLQYRRDKIKQIKQGMMQQLLTGRIRLLSKEAV